MAPVAYLPGGSALDGALLAFHRVPSRRSSVLWAATVASVVLLAGPALADPTTTPTDCIGARRAAADLGKRQELRGERAQLLLCSDPSCPDDIRTDCVTRAEQLKSQIPTLVVDAKDPSGARLGAVKVTMDGEVVAERLDAAGFAVDPGEHTFLFETPGQPLVVKTWLISPTQKERHEAIDFPGPTAVAAPAPPPSTTPSQSIGDGTGGASGRTIATLIGAGVAVVGVGLGTAYGILAITRKSDAHDVCPGPTLCATQEGVNRWSSAQSAANISTVMFVVGGIGALEAAIFWFTPDSDTPSTKVGLGPGMVQVKGAW